MNIAEKLIEALHAKDANRSRSKQTQIGPSELGGCKRRVWYRLHDQEVVNPNQSKLAAIMGTAIHKEIEHAMEALGEPTKFLIETEVEFDGMKAHVDLYLPEEKEVVDWKTVKIKNLGFFPSRQQRWQVHTYGYLLRHGNNMDVERVTLVAIPRDGGEDDIVTHTEPYNEGIAIEALDWLEEIKNATEIPAPEKDAQFCKSYCPFYDASGIKGCTGRTARDEIYQLIPDPGVDNVAKEYLELDKQVRVLSTKRDALKTSMEEWSGQTASGIKIKWQPQAGRSSVDSAEVEKLLGFIPKKQGKDTFRLIIQGEENVSE